MTKREKVLVGIIIFLLVVILFGASYIISEHKNSSKTDENKEDKITKEHEKIKVADYFNLLETEGTHIVFIGRPTCPYSETQDPILKEVAAEKELTIYYLNIDEETSENLQKLKDSSDMIKSIVTPTHIIIKDKQLAVLETGLMQKESYISFLRTNGIVE